MAELQGRLTGIALPKLVCDTPGGHGKVPLLPDYVVARRPGRTTLRTFRGEEIEYIDPDATALNSTPPAPRLASKAEGA
jgi:lysine 2,3-aminomutase